MDLPTLLPLLADHLSVGDLFRVSRACHLQTWPADVAGLAARRMGLSRGNREETKHSVAVKMRTTQRCVECGVPTRRAVRACVACTSDPRSFVALLSRHDIFDLYPYLTLHKLRTRLVPVPQRGVLGRFYYRARHVRSVLGAPQGRIA